MRASLNIFSHYVARKTGFEKTSNVSTCNHGRSQVNPQETALVSIVLAHGAEVNIRTLRRLAMILQLLSRGKCDIDPGRGIVDQPRCERHVILNTQNVYIVLH